MKKDGEILLYLNERRKGASQLQAAARAGISERTARQYEHAGQLPSQQKQPRTYRTRANPFADIWAWIEKELTRDPALQADTLFAILQQQYPGQYSHGQLRTLQRHIRSWRVRSGPACEVMFAQIHEPGRMAQSDFTSMNDLAITLSGIPFPHLLFHLMLTFSNVEAVTICFSESIEALAEGIEYCLWEIGGVPLWHRTDNLSAAVIDFDADGRHEFTKNYMAIMAHYRMQAHANKAGCANQNGDVEQSHYRFKRAIDQALRVRGSRDFSDRLTYGRFIAELAHQRNLTRHERFTLEKAALQPLPERRLDFAREIIVRVTRFSTIKVLKNTYSVPSRLIGEIVKIRAHAEYLDLYRGVEHLLRLPRLRGKSQHRIEYRHVIWSLVRKPGAFANYCYREELFPTTTFRQAYDALTLALPSRADREYLHILHLAASQSEHEVETALALLLDAATVPTFDAIKALINLPSAGTIPQMPIPVVNLSVYDSLLSEGEKYA